MPPPDWYECNLGGFVTFQRGFDITKKEQIEGPYSVISSSGVSSTHSEYKVKGPGVVIGRKGSLGTVFYSDFDFWPHDTTLWAKDFHGNNPKFVYYFLKTLHLEQYDVGASNPTLNRNHIHLLPVYVPKPEIQSKIAAILSAYDDLIENNTQRIRALEAAAQTLYREWFVEFRFPGHESVTFVPSELGDIPAGWEVVKIGDVVELAYGKSLTEKSRIPGEYPVYGSAGIVGSHNKYLVEGPSIIVGRKGNVGSIFWSDKSFYPIDTVYYVQTDVPLHYIFYNFQHQNFINNDAAVPGLNRNQAYSLPFLLPEMKVLGNFVEFVDPIFQQLSLFEERNGLIREGRDLLLPRLISGELDVAEVEIELEETAQ